MRLHILKSAMGILLMSFAINTFSQKMLTENIASAGGGTSSGGSKRLISIVGQPIAYTSSVKTEVKAGFLQAAPYLITDNQAPVITPGVAPNLIKGSSATFSATVTDNIGVSSPVKFYYKPITSPKSAFQFAPMTAGANNLYSVSITSASFDNNLGVEYYFEAKDAANNTTPTPTNGSYVYLTVPSVLVPASAFFAGITIDKYRIIAMPYTSASGEEITTIFNRDHGLDDYQTDKTAWRLATYDATNKKIVEYPDPNLSKFKRGEGYWFLVKNPKTINLGNKITPDNNRDNLFKITLKTGWNMIGNPYPVAIKWSDVQNFAGNTPKPGDLIIYDGSSIEGSFKTGFKTATTGTDLPPFQGGFVNNTGPDVVITIPFIGQTTVGGRKAVEPSTDISSNNWQVKVGIYQGNTFNELGRFGMMPPQELKDEALAFNPPAFENAPEINFESKNPLLQKLCKALVPTAPGNSWAFNTAGEIGQPAELKWDTDLGGGTEPLFLLDEQTLKIINMRETGSYTFTLNAGYHFRVLYGIAAEKIAPPTILIGAPFPNPAIDRKITFVVGLPESTEKFEVGTQIYNGNGIAFLSETKSLASGIHSLIWQANEKESAGIYYYRIQVRSSKGLEVSTGKIIIHD